jgi:hypothetical protein
VRTSRRTPSFYCFWTAATLLIFAWVTLLVWGARLSDAALSQWIPGFLEAERSFGPSSLGHVHAVVVGILSLFTAVFVAAVVVLRFSNHLARTEIQIRLISNLVAIATVCVLFHNLAFREWEAPWYNVHDMMNHPENVPVFGQRLLMIWPSILLKHLLPNLSDIQCFIVVQGLGIVLAVYAVGEWSALFVGRQLMFVGQMFFALFLLPTADFFVAHDIAVVFSYCFCFFFLYKRQYLFFLIAFSIGILNHQNILLLIPTAIAIMWPVENQQTVIGVGALAGIIYVSIQFILNHTIPIPITHEIKVWFNMRQIAEAHRTMIFGAMLTVPWWLAAALAFRNADPFLKRASILLPMQLAIYAVYGQLNEARLFDGFLPILIGIYLCYIRERFLANPLPNRSSRLIEHDSDPANLAREHNHHG